MNENWKEYFSAARLQKTAKFKLLQQRLNCAYVVLLAHLLRLFIVTRRHSWRHRQTTSQSVYLDNVFSAIHLRPADSNTGWPTSSIVTWCFVLRIQSELAVIRHTCQLRIKCNLLQVSWCLSNGLQCPLFRRILARTINTFSFSFIRVYYITSWSRIGPFTLLGKYKSWQPCVHEEECGDVSAMSAYLVLTAAYLVWPCHEVNPHDKA